MLVCVDFQPAYLEAFAHLLPGLSSRLRQAEQSNEAVYFLYNDILWMDGEELGDSLDRVLSWANQESLPLGTARMIRKNFGWIAHAVRDGDERKIAILTLRHLLESEISHSAQISEKDMEQIILGVSGELAHFQRISPLAWSVIKEGAIALPMLFEGGIHAWLSELKSSDHGEGIELIGGFHHRCFDEISMLLEAGRIPYSINHDLVYYLSEETVRLTLQ